MNEKKRKGVVYNKVKGYWVASIYSNGHNCYLGSYKEFEKAVSVREQAEAHVESGDLPEWYEKFRSQNINSIDTDHPGVFRSDGKWAASIYFHNKGYHLGLYTSIEDAVNIRKQAEDHKENGDFLKWFEKRKISKTSIKSKPRERKYKAEISYNGQKYPLGEFDTRYEAAMITDEAKKHLETGFVRWYNENISILATVPTVPPKRRTYKGRRTKGSCTFDSKTEKYQASIGYDNKVYWLGTYINEEDARRICSNAEEHRITGDFIQWYNENSASFYSRKKKEFPEGVRPYGKKWRCSKVLNGKNYYLGLFNSLEEAVAIRKNAERHILSGDFIQWLEKFKASERDRHKRDKEKIEQKNCIKYVRYNNKQKNYSAYVIFGSKRKFLGFFNDENVAGQICDEVCDEALKYIDEDFDVWDARLIEKIEEIKNERQLNKGIYYYKEINKWVVRFPYNKKRYTLGSFSSKDDAIAAKLEALQHTEDFEDWYKDYDLSKKQNNKGAKKRDHCKKDREIEQKNCTKYVRYNEKRRNYSAYVTFGSKKKFLGYFNDENMAEKICDEVCDEALRYIDEDFDVWYARLIEKIENERQLNQGIYYYKETNKWLAKFSHNGKGYALGSFSSKDEAIAARLEALQHTDDFENWYKDYRFKYKEQHPNNKGRRKKGNVVQDIVYYNIADDVWTAKITFKDKWYHLGRFKTKNEADNILMEAREHYDVDFLEWHEAKKEERARQRKSGLSRVSLEDATFYVISRMINGYEMSLDDALSHFRSSETYNEISCREAIYKADLPLILTSYTKEKELE